MKKIILLAAVVLFSANMLNAQTLGKDARYCNPLPMEVGQGSASGDVSVFQWEGKYYMFCTGGGCWVSSDMLNWEFHYVADVPVAPDVCPYNGKFYMTGNSMNVWVADNPLGPYKVLGQWKGTPDLEHGWSQGFDPHIYVDENNQPYLFWPGMAISGIYSVKLDPNDITQFVGPITHHFSFNPDHIWERQGEQNEFPDVAWIEGPWVYKHNGTYYLQYSASGTQWRTYAEGYYKSKNVQGPYEYASNNPLLRRTDGIVTGPAHGSMVTGPDGNIWQFYTIVLRSGGRRIGMDRVIVDANGNLTCNVTDTPQWAPGVVKDPTKGDSGSLIVSVGKTTRSTGGGMPGAAKVASSSKSGRGPEYALDNSTATWWEPEDGDASPTLTISLSPAVDRDRVQTFQVDGARILFGGRGGFGGGFGFGGTPTLPVFKYTIETSMDGENYQLVLDKSKNTGSRNVTFDDIKPVECRFVRLTIVDWPKNAPLSILDFSVFGRATGYSPSQVPVPTPKKMN